MSDVSALKWEIENALRLEDVGAPILAVSQACVDAMPGDGAAITIMTSDSKREAIFARDQVIANLEHLQYNVGEGPSLLAFSTGRPVLVPDITAGATTGQWPALVGALDGQPVRAVFSFPMRFGVINVGVCVLYCREPGPLSPADLAFVLDALDLGTLALLELRQGQHAESLLGRWLAVDGNKRRQVHQATGMLIAQLGVPAEAAFARLRAHAFAHDSNMEDVAAEIVGRRLRLEPDQMPMPTRCCHDRGWAGRISRHKNVM